MCVYGECLLHHSFDNPYVRDLAWALSSPALLHISDRACDWYRDDWYRRLAADSADWLRRLDQDHDALSALVEAERDRRLGRYFELLWAYWFEHSRRYDIIGQNIQIEHEGRTLGELDLLVQERGSGRVIHLELAVKFYLGVGDTRDLANWHGPGRKDRLDSKVNSLLQRQSLLSRQPAAARQLAAMGIHIDACGVILKGRLFYPDAQPRLLPQQSNPRHLQSRWLTLSAFRQQASGDYLPLLRRGWMAGCRPGPEQPLLSAAQILDRLAAAELRLPLYLTDYRNLEENERLFVVPDEWSTTL